MRALQSSVLLAIAFILGGFFLWKDYSAKEEARQAREAHVARVDKWKTVAEEKRKERDTKAFALIKDKRAHLVGPSTEQLDAEIADAESMLSDAKLELERFDARNPKAGKR